MRNLELGFCTRKRIQISDLRKAGTEEWLFRRNLPLLAPSDLLRLSGILKWDAPWLLKSSELCQKL
jgi:hypothetical protein